MFITAVFVLFLIEATMAQEQKPFCPVVFLTTRRVHHTHDSVNISWSFIEQER